MASRTPKTWCLLAVLATLLLVPVAWAQEQLEKLGTVHFPVSCTPSAQKLFDRAIALLHSFFFPETLKAFQAVVTDDPSCAMGYWGLAMSHRANPLILPLDVATLKRGWKAVEKAKAAGPKTQRERDYIAAIEAYYKDPDKGDYKERVLAYEQAMEQVYLRYPNDPEAAIFYGLALNEATDHADKTYARQLKAGRLLEKVFAQFPDHPGVAHYIIHTYDFPPLAQRGLPAARRYAEIAPSSPHALHMPSHIFSMVGLWQDAIKADKASEKAAKAYAAKNLPGQVVWLHMHDFLTYAYLQGAQDSEAKRIVDERNQVQKVTPVRLPNDTAYAAIPARYAIERSGWAEAAELVVPTTQYPQAEAITRFGRALGAARSGNPAAAVQEIIRLEGLRDALMQANQKYWAEQVEIQRLAASAWVARAEGRNDEALASMRAAANLEDRSEKHIAMENRLVPMRELLGDLLLEVGQPAKALAEFEASLKNAPNRFRTYYGAATAAERVGDRAKAREMYGKLVEVARHADTERPELVAAKAYLSKP